MTKLSLGLVYEEFMAGSRIWKILNQNNINFREKWATPPAQALNNKVDPRIQLLGFIALDQILESFITYEGEIK